MFTIAHIIIKAVIDLINTVRTRVETGHKQDTGGNRSFVLCKSHLFLPLKSCASVTRPAHQQSVRARSGVPYAVTQPGPPREEVALLFERRDSLALSRGFI